MATLQPFPAGPETFPYRRVAVLGSQGFIGSHLCERLLAETNATVIGIDRERGKEASNLNHPRMRFIHRQLDATADLDVLLDGAEVVVHLAAICNPSRYNTQALSTIESNFLHTLPAVEDCLRHRRRLIYFSTSEVYGRWSALEDAAPLQEESTPLLLGPVAAERWSYACAKQLAERWIYACGRERGLEFTIVRPFNFIGPRLDYLPGVDGEGVPRVVACFMNALRRGEPLMLVNGGTQRRTFTAIEDAVDAVMAMLWRPAASRGRVFNVGDLSGEVTIRELALRMRDLYREIVPEAPECPLREIPAQEFYGPGYEDSLRRIPDISLAQEHLNWAPRLGFREGLRRTVQWFVDYYADSAARAQPVGVPAGAA